MTKHTDRKRAVFKTIFLKVILVPKINQSKIMTIRGFKVPIMPTVETGKKLKLENPMYTEVAP